MHREKIRIRPLISLTLAFSFQTSLLSGIALYLRPEGALARWLDWSWLGLDKKSWETIHIGAVLLLLICGFWHTLLNWKNLLSYLRKRGDELTLHWKEGLIALVVTVLFTFGPLWHMTPFSQLSTLRGAIKNGETQAFPAPPVADAEHLSLADLSTQISIPEETIMRRLHQHGITPFNSEVTLSDLATIHHRSPAQIYLILLTD